MPFPSYSNLFEWMNVKCINIYSPKDKIMFQRLFRNLIALFTVYGFSTNPLRYLMTLLVLALLPYLVYLLFGSIALVFILAIVALLLWRTLKTKSAHYRAY